LAAVQQDGFAIQYIQNPSEQVLNNAKESLIKTYGDIPSFLEKYFK